MAHAMRQYIWNMHLDGLTLLYPKYYILQYLVKEVFLQSVSKLVSMLLSMLYETV